MAHRDVNHIYVEQVVKSASHFRCLQICNVPIPTEKRLSIEIMKQKKIL